MSKNIYRYRGWKIRDVDMYRRKRSFYTIWEEPKKNNFWKHFPWFSGGIFRTTYRQYWEKKSYCKYFLNGLNLFWRIIELKSTVPLSTSLFGNKIQKKRPIVTSDVFGFCLQSHWVIIQKCGPKMTPISKFDTKILITCQNF